MKRLVLIIISAFTVMFASAQTKVNWGMEVGIGMSSWMGKNANDCSALFNPKVGVTIDIPMTWLVSFQTGLNWTSKGASYKMYEVDSDIHVNQNYFQMPLLAAFHLGTAANFDMVITAGPYIAYGISGKTEYEIGDLDVSWNTFDNVKFEQNEIRGLNRFDAGIQAGLGLDFTKWTVGLDTDFSFCKINSGDAPYNFALYFTFGYKF